MIAEAEELLLCVYCHHPVFRIVDGVWKCGGCWLMLQPTEVEKLKSVLVADGQAGTNAGDANDVRNVPVPSNIAVQGSRRLPVGGVAQPNANMPLDRDERDQAKRKA